jgi:uncharacterized protein
VPHFRAGLAALVVAAGACLLGLGAAQLEIPPSPDRWVTDTAGFLSPAAVREMDRRLEDFQNQSGHQLLVYIGKTTGVYSIEEFAVKAFEAWKPGRKGLDDGLALIIMAEDRKIRIEVGYGLEGVLTDLVAGRIIRDVITPQFRNGNFDQGVVEGTAAMMAAVKGEFSAEQGRTSSGSSENDPGGLLVPLLIGLFFLGRIFRNRWLTAGIGGVAAPVLGFFTFGAHWLIILALIPIGFVAGLMAGIIAASAGSGRMGGGGWSSGGGIGGGLGGFSGGFSGGGGGFGGGGASGGW